MTKRIFMIFLALAFYNPLYAMEINCPKMIAVEQQLAKPLDDWSEAGVKERNHSLERIDIGRVGMKHKAGFIDAPYRADQEMVSSNITKNIWHLQDKQYAYAVFCSYGNTDIQLSKPLPKTIVQCEVAYKVDQWNNYHLLSANCN